MSKKVAPSQPPRGKKGNAIVAICHVEVVIFATCCLGQTKVLREL